MLAMNYRSIHSTVIMQTFIRINKNTNEKGKQAQQDGINTCRISACNYKRNP
jgi:hypothetical protein